ncbi:MAG: hypothetical protein J2P59_07735, partial [Acidimicrobiales bacterium]|nr:hypothetical protein [Acidimicrobiales bacterium]
MRSWLWRRCLLIAGAVTVVAGAAGTAAIAQSGLFDASDPGQPLIHHVMTVTAPPPLSNPASFDISWVDPATQTYYLADRTNNGVDAVNASTDKFEGVIGQGAFVGNGSGPASCTPFGTAGPNGILTL